MTAQPFAELIQAVESGRCRITLTDSFSLTSSGVYPSAYVEVRGASSGRWKRVKGFLAAPTEDNSVGGLLRSLASIADGAVSASDATAGQP